ncbi:jg23102, partial [Pararge aegeria aegeria]
FGLLSLAAGLVVINSEVEEDSKYLGKVIVIFGALTLVAILIALPFTILLLVGLHKEKRNHIRVYLIFAVVCLVLNVILQISKFSGGYASPKEIPSSIVSILLTIYFLLVLRSQYIKMGLSTNNVAMQQYHPEGHLMNEPKV